MFANDCWMIKTSFLCARCFFFLIEVLARWTLLALLGWLAHIPVNELMSVTQAGGQEPAAAQPAQHIHPGRLVFCFFLSHSIWHLRELALQYASSSPGRLCHWWSWRFKQNEKLFLPFLWQFQPFFCCFLSGFFGNQCLSCLSSSVASSALKQCDKQPCIPIDDVCFEMVSATTAARPLSPAHVSGKLPAWRAAC